MKNKTKHCLCYRSH